MKGIDSSLGLFVAVSLLVILSPLDLYALDGYEVVSANAWVFRDGLVHVEQVLLVNVTQPTVVIQLLSAETENLIVVDENDTLLDHELQFGFLTVFSLGASAAKVEYDTWSLTEKEAGVWTLLMTTTHDITVLMPVNSTVIFVNEPPVAIGTEDERLVLSLDEGSWEISYVLEISYAPPPGDAGDVLVGVPFEYWVIGVSAVLLVSLLLLLRTRRPAIDVDRLLRKHPDLRADERRILEYLVERGGRAFEAEIRESLDLPRVTVWRIIKRLELKGIVAVRKVGVQNEVSLSSL